MLKIQQRHVMKQQTLASTNKPNAQPPPLVSATGTPTKQEPSSTNGTVESVHSINRPEGHVSTSFLSICRIIKFFRAVFLKVAKK